MTVQRDQPRKTVLVIGTLPRSLVNFRGDLIKDIVQAGHRVIAMAAKATPEEIREIKSLGAEFRSYTVQRSGLNPIHDLRTIFSLLRAFAEFRPEVVLAYTIKPVIWSGLSLRVISKARFYALITGLGFAFQGGSYARRTITWIATILYRTSLKRATVVMFQNPDNRDVFVKRSISIPEKCHVVNGSGVNTQDFSVQEFPQSDMTFLLIARLLGEKGIREYVAAAQVVKRSYSNAKFHLVGPLDPSPDGIPKQELDSWRSQGNIIYHGPVEDVRPHIKRCHVFVLPSYHEGMPRTVLEAMAMGRPIVTTDVAGCRETVIDGKNGYLVPKGDPIALARKMIWFIENLTELPRMGRVSREMTEKKFDVKAVNASMLQIMELASTCERS